EKGPPPQLLFVATILTPESFSDLIRSRHSIAPPTSPPPWASKNLQGRIWTCQFTPLTPTPLLPTAPIVPETWVPWPLSSMGSQVPDMELKPREFVGQVMEFPLMSFAWNEAVAVQMFWPRSVW